MKAQLGVSTGLALALLSTLLATLFAMGAFSVALANEHSATRSFSETTVAPGGEIEVTIDVRNAGRGGAVSDTLPEGFTYVENSSSGGFSAGVIDDVVGIAFSGAASSISYKATASQAEDEYAFAGTLETEDGIVDIVGDSIVTVAAAGTAPGGGTAPMDDDGPESGQAQL